MSMLYTVEYEDGNFYVSAFNGIEALEYSADALEAAVLLLDPDARFQYEEHAHYAKELGIDGT